MAARLLCCALLGLTALLSTAETTDKLNGLITVDSEGPNTSIDRKSLNHRLQRSKTPNSLIDEEATDIIQLGSPLNVRRPEHGPLIEKQNQDASEDSFVGRSFLAAPIKLAKNRNLKQPSESTEINSIVSEVDTENVNDSSFFTPHRKQEKQDSKEKNSRPGQNVIPPAMKLKNPLLISKESGILKTLLPGDALKLPKVRRGETQRLSISPRANLNVKDPFETRRNQRILQKLIDIKSFESSTEDSGENWHPPKLFQLSGSLVSRNAAKNHQERSGKKTVLQSLVTGKTDLQAVAPSAKQIMLNRLLDVDSLIRSEAGKQTKLQKLTITPAKTSANKATISDTVAENSSPNIKGERQVLKALIGVSSLEDTSKTRKTLSKKHHSKRFGKKNLIANLQLSKENEKLRNLFITNDNSAPETLLDVDSLRGFGLKRFFRTFQQDKSAYQSTSEESENENQKEAGPLKSSIRTLIPSIRRRSKAALDITDEIANLRNNDWKADKSYFKKLISKGQSQSKTSNTLKRLLAVDISESIETESGGGRRNGSFSFPEAIQKNDRLLDYNGESGGLISLSSHALSGEKGAQSTTPNRGEKRIHRIDGASQRVSVNALNVPSQRKDFKYPKLANKNSLLKSMLDVDNLSSHGPNSKVKYNLIKELRQDDSSSDNTSQESPSKVRRRTYHLNKLIKTNFPGEYEYFERNILEGRDNRRPNDNIRNDKRLLVNSINSQDLLRKEKHYFLEKWPAYSAFDSTLSKQEKMHKVFTFEPKASSVYGRFAEHFPGEMFQENGGKVVSPTGLPDPKILRANKGYVNLVSRTDDSKGRASRPYDKNQVHAHGSTSQGEIFKTLLKPNKSSLLKSLVDLNYLKSSDEVNAGTRVPSAVLKPYDTLSDLSGSTSKENAHTKERSLRPVKSLISDRYRKKDKYFEHVPKITEIKSPYTTKRRSKWIPSQSVSKQNNIQDLLILPKKKILKELLDVDKSDKSNASVIKGTRQMSPSLTAQTFSSHDEPSGLYSMKSALEVSGEVGGLMGLIHPKLEGNYEKYAKPLNKDDNNEIRLRSFKQKQRAGQQYAPREVAKMIYPSKSGKKSLLNMLLDIEVLKSPSKKSGNINLLEIHELDNGLNDRQLGKNLQKSKGEANPLDSLTGTSFSSKYLYSPHTPNKAAGRKPQINKLNTKKRTSDQSMPGENGLRNPLQLLKSNSNKKLNIQPPETSARGSKGKEHGGLSLLIPKTVSKHGSYQNAMVAGTLPNKSREMSNKMRKADEGNKHGLSSPNGKNQIYVQNTVSQKEELANLKLKINGLLTSLLDIDSLDGDSLNSKHYLKLLQRIDSLSRRISNESLYGDKKKRKPLHFISDEHYANNKYSQEDPKHADYQNRQKWSSNQSRLDGNMHNPLPNQKNKLLKKLLISKQSKPQKVTERASKRTAYGWPRFTPKIINSYDVSSNEIALIKGPKTNAKFGSLTGLLDINPPREKDEAQYIPQDGDNSKRRKNSAGKKKHLPEKTRESSQEIEPKDAINQLLKVWLNADSLVPPDGVTKASQRALEALHIPGDSLESSRTSAPSQNENTARPLGHLRRVMSSEGTGFYEGATPYLTSVSSQRHAASPINSKRSKHPSGSSEENGLADQLNGNVLSKLGKVYYPHQSKRDKEQKRLKSTAFGPDSYNRYELSPETHAVKSARNVKRKIESVDGLIGPKLSKSIQKYERGPLHFSRNVIRKERMNGVSKSLPPEKDQKLFELFGQGTEGFSVRTPGKSNTGLQSELTSEMKASHRDNFKPISAEHSNDRTHEVPVNVLTNRNVNLLPGRMALKDGNHELEGVKVVPHLPSRKDSIIQELLGMDWRFSNKDDTAPDVEKILARLDSPNIHKARKLIKEPTDALFSSSNSLESSPHRKVGKVTQNPPLYPKSRRNYNNLRVKGFKDNYDEGIKPDFQSRGKLSLETKDEHLTRSKEPYLLTNDPFKVYLKSELLELLPSEQGSVDNKKINYLPSYLRSPKILPVPHSGHKLKTSEQNDGTPVGRWKESTYHTKKVAFNIDDNGGRPDEHPASEYWKNNAYWEDLLQKDLSNELPEESEILGGFIDVKHLSSSVEAKTPLRLKNDLIRNLLDSDSSSYDWTHSMPTTPRIKEGTHVSGNHEDSNNGYFLHLLFKIDGNDSKLLAWEASPSNPATTQESVYQILDHSSSLQPAKKERMQNDITPQIENDMYVRYDKSIADHQTPSLGKEILRLRQNDNNLLSYAQEERGRIGKPTRSSARKLSDDKEAWLKKEPFTPLRGSFSRDLNQQRLRKKALGSKHNPRRATNKKWAKSSGQISSHAHIFKPYLDNKSVNSDHSFIKSNNREVLKTSQTPSEKNTVSRNKAKSLPWEQESDSVSNDYSLRKRPSEEKMSYFVHKELYPEKPVAFKSTRKLHVSGKSPQHRRKTERNAVLSQNIQPMWLNDKRDSSFIWDDSDKPAEHELHVPSKNPQHRRKAERNAVLSQNIQPIWLNDKRDSSFIWDDSDEPAKHELQLPSKNPQHRRKAERNAVLSQNIQPMWLNDKRDSSFIWDDSDEPAEHELHVPSKTPQHRRTAERNAVLSQNIQPIWLNDKRDSSFIWDDSDEPAEHELHVSGKSPQHRRKTERNAVLSQNIQPMWLNDKRDSTFIWDDSDEPAEHELHVPSKNPQHRRKAERNAVLSQNIQPIWLNDKRDSSFIWDDSDEPAEHELHVPSKNPQHRRTAERNAVLSQNIQPMWLNAKRDSSFIWDDSYEPAEHELHVSGKSPQHRRKTERNAVLSQNIQPMWLNDKRDSTFIWDDSDEPAEHELHVPSKNPQHRRKAERNAVLSQNIQPIWLNDKRDSSFIWDDSDEPAEYKWQLNKKSWRWNPNQAGYGASPLRNSNSYRLVKQGSTHFGNSPEYLNVGLRNGLRDSNKKYHGKGFLHRLLHLRKKQGWDASKTSISDLSQILGQALNTDSSIEQQTELSSESLTGEPESYSTSNSRNFLHGDLNRASVFRHKILEGSKWNDHLAKLLDLELASYSDETGQPGTSNDNKLRQSQLTSIDNNELTPLQATKKQLKDNSKSSSWAFSESEKQDGNFGLMESPFDGSSTSELSRLTNYDSENGNPSELDWDFNKRVKRLESIRPDWKITEFGQTKNEFGSSSDSGEYRRHAVDAVGQSENAFTGNIIDEGSRPLTQRGLQSTKSSFDRNVNAVQDENGHVPDPSWINKENFQQESLNSRFPSEHNANEKNITLPASKVTEDDIEKDGMQNGWTITARVNLTGLANNVVDSFANGLDKLNKWRTDLVDFAGDAVKNGINSVTKGVKTLADNGLEMGKQFTNWMQSSEEDRRQGFAKAVEDRKKDLQRAIDKAADFAKSGFLTMENLGRKAFEGISKLGSAAQNGLQTISRLAHRGSKGLTDIVDNAVAYAKGSQTPHSLIQAGRQIARNLAAEATLKISGEGHTDLDVKIGSDASPETTSVEK